MVEQVRRVLYCSHCGNQAPQRLIHKQQYMEKAWSVSDGAEDKQFWSTFVTVCETCGHILLYDNPGDQFSDNEFHLCDLAYPKSGSLHPSVPKSIAKVYEEAHRIKSIAPNAFAVQIRRALEAICDDRGAKKNSLQKQLEELSTKGEIPPVLAEASDALRLLDNIGAHGINESVHPLQAFAVDDFFRAIVEYVYVAPSKLKEFKRKMEGFKKAKKQDNAQPLQGLLLSRGKGIP
jgi:hypothetical protein